jgi:hypothetical protein
MLLNRSAPAARPFSGGPPSRHDLPVDAFDGGPPYIAQSSFLDIARPTPKEGGAFSRGPFRLDILLCAPRGFCAGVVRAIDAVEKALSLHGAPVYVRHEIVHNKYVVESLKRKGAVFVEELSQVPDADAAGDLLRPWRAEIGAGRGGPARNLFAIDATCPLVTKVHREAARSITSAAATSC